MFRSGDISKARNGGNEMSKGKGKSSGTIIHTVRTADKGTKTLKVTRKLSQSIFCTECMGFETAPELCTSIMCPMYPFRAGTRKTLKGDNV